MSKTWQPGRKGARDLNRHISKGTTVYTVRKIATNLAPYEDPERYHAHTFDWFNRLTGHWMTGHLSAEGLLLQEGTVYAEPPRGMRNAADPAPQYAAPLGSNDYRGHLDSAEIRGLEKRVKDGSDPYTRGGRGGTPKPKRRFSW